MLTQLLNDACSKNPQKTAIVWGTTRITYRQLQQLSETMAQKLLEQNVSSGQCVAFILPNCPEFIVSFFACARLRAIALPLSPQYTADEVGRLINDTEACLVITDEQHLPVLELACKNQKATSILVVEPGSLGATLDSTSQTTENTAGLPADYAPFSGPALYLYTSGSTDSYKRLTCTQENLYWEALNFVEATALTSDDTILCTIPLYHSYGIGNCIMDAVFTKATLVLQGPARVAQSATSKDKLVPFSAGARDLLKLIAEEGVKFFPGVPHQFRVLANLAGASRADLGALRLCVSSGDVLTRGIFLSFLERYGLPIRSLYGSTEAGSIAMNLDADADVEFGSLGLPLPNVQIEIRDVNQANLPTGEPGRIWVKSPVIPPTGYENSAALSTATFIDGFYDSGDVGFIDSRGHLVLQGRKQSFVDVAGYKVDITEVEEILMEHPLVRDAAALAVEVPSMGTMLKAALVTSEPVAELAIRTYCRERMAFFKIPRLIEFLPALPRSPIGKVMKKDLSDITPWLQGISPSAGDLGRQLKSNANQEQNRRLLQTFVHGQIAIVLGKPQQTLAIKQGFTALGMDSMSSLELCARLEYALGRKLPSTIAFDHPTTVALAEALLPAQKSDASEEKENLDDLSSEQLAQLLASELREFAS
jgi:long-chain acyl-CoA synthetase